MSIAKTSYWQRSRQRAWTETKATWTLTRWWIGGSSPLAGTATFIARGGWRNVDNHELAITFAAACLPLILGFGGTWIINLIRAPKLLDQDRETVAAELTEQVAASGLKVVALQASLDQKNPVDEHADGVVREKLSATTNEEREVLVQLIHHEPCTYTELRNVMGNHRREEIDAAIQKAVSTGLVHEIQDPRMAVAGKWAVRQGLRDSLCRILLEKNRVDNRPVTPLQV